MTTEVLVAIWSQAPFQGSIFRGIEELNKHLKAKNIDVSYEPILVNVRKPKDAHIFILDGGEDVDPQRYGQKNEHSHFSKARDKAEFSLTEHYADKGARISGICRGHQLINVFFGGTLFQDIRHSKLVREGENHSSGHKVFLSRQPRQSILPNFVGSNSFTVSSLHHQAVRDYGKGIQNTLVWKPQNKSKSYYAQNLVEGIESRDNRIRGLQCHPEFRGYPKDGLLFAYLMHVDAYAREFVSLDTKRLETKFGKANLDSTFYPRESSRPERPSSAASLRRTFTSSNTVDFNTPPVIGRRNDEFEEDE